MSNDVKKLKDSIIHMVKTDMRCAKKECGWTHTAHIDDTLHPTMYMCGRCLSVGLEVVKRYFLDKSNYTIPL